MERDRLLQYVHVPAEGDFGQQPQQRGRRRDTERRWLRDQSKLLCTILRHGRRSEVHWDRRTDATLDVSTVADAMHISEELVLQLLQMDDQRPVRHFERKTLVASNGRRHVRVRAKDRVSLEGIDGQLLRVEIQNGAPHM